MNNLLILGTNELSNFAYEHTNVILNEKQMVKKADWQITEPNVINLFHSGHEWIVANDYESRLGK